MTTNQHGGPRPATRPDDGRRNNRPPISTGRPHIDPSGDTVRVTVRLTQPQMAWLQAQADNLSDVLRAVIDAARAQ